MNKMYIRAFVMMRFLLLLTGIIFSAAAGAQVIAPNDTFLCTPVPLDLVAVNIGGGGTTVYADSLIGDTLISFIGTEYQGPDDQHSAAVPIGFDFCFFGETYDSVVVSTNNYITFDPAYAGAFSPWVTTAIPNVNAPHPAIMGPWVDIHPGVGGTIRYGTVGVAPFRMFIASYENVPMFSCTNLIYNGQIIIYESSNHIETHVDFLPLCSSWNSGHATHGLHDHTGTQAYVVTGRNNTSYTLSNEGRRFYPIGPSDVYWWDLAGNLLHTGDTLSVMPTVTTQYVVGLECGGYRDTVTVHIGSFPPETEVRAAECWGESSGQIIVEMPTPDAYDVSWLDLSGNALQFTTGMTMNDTINGLPWGAYVVQLYNPVNGCTLKDTLAINQPPPIMVDSTYGDAICDSNAAWIDMDVIDFYGSLEWEWNDGSTLLDRSGLTPGLYEIIFTDSLGCDTTYSFDIQFVDPLEALVSASPDNGSVPLVVSFGNSSIGSNNGYWDFGDGETDSLFEPQHIFTEPGVYTVIFFLYDDDLGCEDSDTLYIRVGAEGQLSMPNVFVPNGEYPFFNAITANDSTSNLAEFRATIYNRWGRKLYEWNDWADPASGWSGQIGGQMAPEGTYYYVVKARGVNGELIEKAGYFQLFHP